MNPTSAMNIDNSGSRESIFAKVSSERKGNENRRVKVDFLPVLCQFVWEWVLGTCLT